MNITVILDKSTFQSLSRDELVRLCYYYKHNIPPVLTMEILGDLKKEAADGKAPSEERVKDFAKKLFPSDTIVNVHYTFLIEDALVGGDPPSLDGRPNINVKPPVVSSSGQKGFIVDESEEEKAIYNWREGNFSLADKVLSELWRTTTTNESVLKNLKNRLSGSFPTKIKDFEELNRLVDEHISSPGNQQNLLIYLMETYLSHKSDIAVQVWQRWIREGMPPLKKFAPYAFHCLKVDFLFWYGLTSELVGTRPTNRVDLEYLYYLPFCNVFSSNDKVHKNLTPLLLQPYQQFIVGTDLKQDLKAIVDHLNTLDQEEIKKLKNKPPVIQTSFTFKLWQKYFNYPDSNELDESASERALERFKEKMKEFEQVLENGTTLESLDKPDFIIRQSRMSEHDPCFCGSGKKVIDCCIPEQKFDELILKQQSKKDGGE